MEILKIGSQGDNVKRLQAKLGLKADGSFGIGTQTALMAWQYANGISPANGVADMVTLQKLGLDKPDPVAPVSPPVTEKPAAVTSGSVDKPATPPTVEVPKTAATPTLNYLALKGAIPANVLDQIAAAASKFNITTNLRLAHFLSQCAQESGVFKVVEENLNYSAARLVEVFPKYFPGDTAKDYANKPQKIGSRIYGGRLGNGPEATGEGYKFRGRGYIQLTGKNNYTAFTKFIGEDCVANPDLVASKYPLASAAYYFDGLAKLWPICDAGSDDATIKKVTKAVNGGYLGLAERTAFFKKYWALLSKPV